MATRHNLCINPALGSNVTGWGGGSTPTRITGVASDFSGTDTAAHYAANNYIQTPSGSATPGLQYTASVDAKNLTGFDTGNKTIYLAFKRSSGGDDFSQTIQKNFTNGVVTTVSITGTAPANATDVYIIIDTISAQLGSGFNVTRCLLEQTATALPYFDGNSTNGSWDGPSNNSSSTLTDAPAGPSIKVWNGATELAVGSVTVWNGSTEVAAHVDSVST